MRPRLALVLALTLGLAPLSAHADRPAARADRTSYATTYERLAHRLKGLDPQLAKAQAGFDSASLIRGADFDGDGEEEVVDVRSHIDDGGETWTQTLRLDVRRGRDGKLLWSKTLGPASFVFPVFAKTGAKGGMGIVGIEYDGVYADGVVAGAGAVDTTVTTYDGKGTQVWTQAFKSGGASAIGGGSGLDTYVDGIFDANPGGGSEVLITRLPAGYAWDPVGVTEVDANTVATAILDGVTGQARQLAPVVTTSALVYAQPVSDLDKDGREDVVVAGATGTTTTLWALKASDGTVLWACRDLPGAYASFPQDVGDVTGDKVPDVAVAAANFATFPLATFQDSRTTLVDGAKGTATWTKAGYPMTLGNADRKPGNEVALGDFLDDSESEFGFAVSAVNAAGNTVWKTKRSVSLKGLDSYMAEGSFGATGDTGPDGVNEIGYSLTITGKGVSRADEGTINGRTGKALRDPVAGMYASRLAFDGHGADAYKVDTTKPKLIKVAAYAGDTGRKLWATTLSIKGFGSPGTSLFAGPDKCADITVAANDNGTTTHYVLSGANGRVLWAVSRSGSGAGKVTHPAGRTTLSKRSC